MKTIAKTKKKLAELLKGHHNSITTPEHGDQNSCSLEHLSHKRFFCHICVLVELSFCSLPYLSSPPAPNFQILLCVCSC